MGKLVGDRRGRGGGLRRDGVDADVLVTVIDGGRFGHAHDGVLGEREICVSNERRGDHQGSPREREREREEGERGRKRKEPAFLWLRTLLVV